MYQKAPYPSIRLIYTLSADLLTSIAENEDNNRATDDKAVSAIYKLTKELHNVIIYLYDEIDRDGERFSRKKDTTFNLMPKEIVQHIYQLITLTKSELVSIKTWVTANNKNAIKTIIINDGLSRLHGHKANYVPSSRFKFW